MSIGGPVEVDLPGGWMLGVRGRQCHRDGLLVRVVGNGDLRADWLGAVEAIELLLKLDFLRVIVRPHEFDLLAGGENAETEDAGCKNDEIGNDRDRPRIAGFE